MPAVSAVAMRGASAGLAAAAVVARHSASDAFRSSAFHLAAARPPLHVGAAADVARVVLVQ